MTARVNYTMTPNLSLQVYAQPFVSAGRYTNYKELVDVGGSTFGWVGETDARPQPSRRRSRHRR